MHNCTKIPPKKLAMGEWPSTSLKVTVIGATRQDTHDLPKFKRSYDAQQIPIGSTVNALELINIIHTSNLKCSDCTLHY